MDSRLCFLALLLSAALPAGLAHATSDTPAEKPTFAEIHAQQVELRNEVEKRRGAFKDMPASKRNELLGQQARVIEITARARSLEQLDDEDRLELFNSLEFIRATVAQAEGDRKVCEKSKFVGSNRHQVVCMTAAERQKIRSQTRDALGREVRCNESEAGCVGF